jgi:hypothetical protein
MPGGDELADQQSLTYEVSALGLFFASAAAIAEISGLMK